MSLRRGVFVCVALLAALAIALYYGLKPDHPDALWRIVSQQCLPISKRMTTRRPARR